MKFVKYKDHKYVIKKEKLDLSYKNIKNISDIEGLDKLENLRELNLKSNKISVIEGLDNLRELETLDLESNEISEIKGIENLINLRRLKLKTNQITEIKGIDTLDNLIELDLEENQITEIKGLEKFAKLNLTINLKNNPIYEDLSSGVETLKGIIPKNELTALYQLDSLKRDFYKQKKIIVTDAVIIYPENCVSVKENKVSGLSLHHCELEMLPQSILELGSLEFLILRDCSISSIQNQIGKLKKLKYLDLGNNHLKTIPNSVGEFLSLKDLDLSNNQLISVPDTIGSLKHLENLSLRGNKGLVLPNSICNLQSLKKLDLDNIFLKSLPESIGDLRYLEVLKISDHDLEALPESFTKLENLKDLSLSGRYNDKLKTLPESFGKLKSLEKINLNNNSLKELPESFGDLISLKEAYLGWNCFTIFPESMGNLASLRYLSLIGNQLIFLPESIENLSSLHNLRLSDNYLKTLPESIGNLHSLENLELQNNLIENLPEKLKQLTSLEELNIENNKLITIPFFLRKMKNSGVKIQIESSLRDQFREFIEYKGSKYEIHNGELKITNTNGVFDANDIKGFEDITKLSFLMVQKIFEVRNIEIIPGLESLDLHKNKITEIKGFEKASNLKKLYLSDNRISEIKNLENLTNLEELWISGNEITTIQGLEKLTKLKVLRLNKNQLTEISNIETLRNLEELYLNENKLSEIKGLDKLINLKILEIKENQLKEIKGLDSLVNLKQLNLGSNQIDKIKGLENLKKLKNLDLRSNQIRKFEGLENLLKLEDFEISANNITEIENLENLIKLNKLYLGHSNISNQELFTDLKIDYEGWSSLGISNRLIHQRAQSYVTYCGLKNKLDKPINEIKSINLLEFALLEKLSDKGDITSKKVFILELGAKIANGDLSSLDKVLKGNFFEILDDGEIREILADPDLKLTNSLIKELEKEIWESRQSIRLINEIGTYLSKASIEKILHWVRQISFKHLCELFVNNFFEFIEVKRIEELVNDPGIFFIENILQSKPDNKFRVLKVLTDLGVTKIRKLFVEEVKKAIRTENTTLLPLVVSNKYLYYLEKSDIDTLLEEPDSFFYENIIEFIEGKSEVDDEQDRESSKISLSVKRSFLISLVMRHFEYERDSEKREKYLKTLIPLDEGEATLYYVFELKGLVGVDDIPDLILHRNREKSSIRRLATSILTILNYLLREMFSSNPDEDIYHFCVRTFWDELEDLYLDIMNDVYSTDKDIKFEQITDFFEIYSLLIKKFSGIIEERAQFELSESSNGDLEYWMARESAYEWMTEDSDLYDIQDGFFSLNYTFDGGELKKIIEKKKYQFIKSEVE